MIEQAPTSDSVTNLRPGDELAVKVTATRLYDLAAGLLFLAATLEFWANGVGIARHSSLWMDEVLAVWTARQPDLSGVWSALVRGSEFSPPAFDSLLHLIIRAGFSSNLAMRLPSLIAMYLAAIAIGHLVRVRSGWCAGVVAAAFILLSHSAFIFALQARPYACALAATAWALVLWEGSLEKERIGWRAAGIGILLGLAQALHFYSILVIAGFGVAELGWSIIRHRLRWPMLGAIVSAGASIELWHPIMRAASAYSSAETSAPNFYGRPSLERLMSDYLGLVGLYPVILATIAGSALVLIVRGKWRGLTKRPGDDRLLAIALLFALYPFGVYLFALIVSHSFVDRYALPGIIGFALLPVWLMRKFVAQAQVAALLATAGMVALNAPATANISGEPTRQDSLAVLESAPGDLPIATGGALRYLEAMEALPPKVSRRLVLLTFPDSAAAELPNQHEAQRWAAIRPALIHSEPAESFLCRTPNFLLFINDGDSVPTWLQTYPVRLVWINTGHARLALASGRSCGQPAIPQATR